MSLGNLHSVFLFDSSGRIHYDSLDSGVPFLFVEHVAWVGEGACNLTAEATEASHIKPEAI